MLRGIWNGLFGSPRSTDPLNEGLPIIAEKESGPLKTVLSAIRQEVVRIADGGVCYDHVGVEASCLLTGVPCSAYRRPAENEIPFIPGCQEEFRTELEEDFQPSLTCVAFGRRTLLNVQDHVRATGCTWRLRSAWGAWQNHIIS